MFKIKTKSFAFRLSTALLSFISILFAIVFIINFFFTRDVVLNEVKKTARYITSSKINYFDGIQHTVEQMPENLALLFEENILEKQNIGRILKAMLKRSPEIYGSTIAFNPGVLIGNNQLYSPYYYKSGDSIKYKDLSLSYNYLEQDWYKTPTKYKMLSWSEPYFDEGGGNILMTTYSVPFFVRQEGKRIFAGIITADISLEWLTDEVVSKSSSKNSFIFILTQTGKFLSHPNPEYILGKTIFEVAAESNSADVRNIGTRMVAGDLGFVKTKQFGNVKNAWIYFEPMHSGGWSLGVVYSEKVLFNELNKLNSIIIIISFISFFVLLGLIILVSSRSVKPIHRLAETAEIIAGGNLDVEVPGLDSSNEVAALSKSMSFMIKELKEYIVNLTETTADKEKYESELRIAHQIQMGMIPKSFPPFPDRPEIDIYAVLEPAREVGGDLYDFFFINEHQLCFAIGDVSGKGVPASLLMAVTRTLLRAKSVDGITVEKLINVINNSIKEENQSKLFVTFFVGIIDFRTGKLTFSNAGHNFPFVIRADGNLEQLEYTHGLPIGSGLSGNYSSDETTLFAGDKIVLYTDGISEAMNGLDEMFEERRIHNKLSLHPNLDVKETTELLISAVKDFAAETEQYDDMTILTIQFKGNISEN